MAMFKTHRVQVLVRRSPMSEIPRVIFKHELPLLNEMHGEGAVKVINAPESVVGGPVNLDAKAEWSRLIDVYGMHPEQAGALVDIVFNRQLSMMVAAVKDEVESFDNIENNDGIVSIEQIGPKNYDDVETLKLALTDLGVTFAKNAGKAALTEKLKAAALEQLTMHGVNISDGAELPEIMSSLTATEGA